MSKLLDENATVKDLKDGFETLDPSTKKIMNFLMDKNLRYMTEFVKRCYTDQVLTGNYEALRKLYSHDDWKSKSSARELYRPPHHIVHRFIDAEMTKKYGIAWRQDKKTFRKVCKTEPLIEPWLLVPRDKI